MSGSLNTINIPGYPVTNRVPGAFSVVDSSRANTGQQVKRALILGQMLAAGVATPLTPLLSAGVGDAQAQFGAGSQLAIMVERYRALDSFGELWCVPLQDATGATKQTNTLTVGGTATAAGTLPLYIDANSVPVGVNVGDAAATIATNIAAAVNAWASPGGNPLPWTATAATDVVTLTARNGGTLAGQGLLPLIGYYGPAGGEVTPAQLGITVAVAAGTAGATDPQIATALANLPDKTFDFICCPYADPTNLDAMQSFLSDATGRWNWSEELFGHAFTGYCGTFGERAAFGNTRNDQHLSAGGLNGAPDPAWHYAVDLCATAAVSLRANPAVPVGGLGGGAPMNVLAPPLAARDSFSERDTLLYDGFSTFVVTDAGQVLVQRLVTTYQTNAGGAPDDSYLDINVPFCVEAWIQARRSMILSDFNQAILVADGSTIPPGSAMVTSQTVKAHVIALYRALALTGLVQNPDQFAQAIVAQNAGNGLVTLREPIQIANQLYQVAADVQFRRP